MTLGFFDSGDLVKVNNTYANQVHDLRGKYFLVKSHKGNFPGTAVLLSNNITVSVNCLDLISSEIGYN